MSQTSAPTLDLQAATLQLILDTAHKAQAAESKVDVVPIDDTHEYLIVKPDGSYEVKTDPVPPRRHRLATVGHVDGLVEAYAGKVHSVWYSAAGVTVILDDDHGERREERATVEFKRTPLFVLLCELHKKTFSHKQLMTFIRRELWSAFESDDVRDALLNTLKVLSFTNADTGHSHTEVGRASYSREVSGEVRSQGGDLRQFERMSLAVRVFDDPALRMTRTVRVLLEDDPLERSFVLVPVAEDLVRAVDDELENVAGILSSIEGPLFHGSPE